MYPVPLKMAPLFCALAISQRVLKAALRGPRTNRPAAPASAADVVAELDDRDYFSRAAGKEPGSRDAWPTLLKVPSEMIPSDPRNPFSQSHSLRSGSSILYIAAISYVHMREARCCVVMPVTLNSSRETMMPLMARQLLHSCI